MHLILTALILVLALLANAEAAAADTAREAWDRGEHEAAVRIWKKQALRHDRQAQWILGTLLETGQGGLAASAEHAASWYARAAKGSRPDAAFYRALAHTQGKGGLAQDPERAERAIQIVLNSTHPDLWVRLGRCYAGGHWPACGLPQDGARAERLFQRASERGYLEGHCALADLYESSDRTAAARQMRDEVGAYGHRCGDAESAKRLYVEALRGRLPLSAGIVTPPAIDPRPEPIVTASRSPEPSETGSSLEPVTGPLEYGRYHALVIGIDGYTNLPALRTARADATAIAELLRVEYGFETEVVLDATRADVMGALTRLRKKLGPADNLLIYYAGHGWLDEEAQEGFWLPIDADKEDPTNWIANSDVTRNLRALQAKHVLVVSDSCYSGTLTRGIQMKQDPTDRYRAKMARLRTRVALSSGGLEPVVDSGGGGHSVFAAAFLDALGSNEGVMEGYDLFLSIRRPVALEADQTPAYGDIRSAAHKGGDFLFVRTSPDQ